MEVILLLVSTAPLVAWLGLALHVSTVVVALLVQEEEEEEEEEIVQQSVLVSQERGVAAGAAKGARTRGRGNRALIAITKWRGKEVRWNLTLDEMPTEVAAILGGIMARPRGLESGVGTEKERERGTGKGTQGGNGTVIARRQCQEKVGVAADEKKWRGVGMEATARRCLLLCRRRLRRRRPSMGTESNCATMRH